MCVWNNYIYIRHANISNSVCETFSVEFRNKIDFVAGIVAGSCD